MDFAAVLRLVGGFLESRGRRFAVVGGVAMAAWGMPRSTLDLDLIVDGEAQDELVQLLESEGWETLHRSRGYSNHLHSVAERGRLDVVYVRGDTAAAIFGAVRRVGSPGGVAFDVPRPEHLAAMKIHAMKQDPGRTYRDLADIRHLLSLNGVDREEVRDYFTRHGLEARYDELVATL